MKTKLLTCFFLPDVFCSFRTSEKFTAYFLSTRCAKCIHYERFNRDMDEEEEKFWEEADKIEKYGYPKDFSDFKESKS